MLLQEHASVIIEIYKYIINVVRMAVLRHIDHFIIRGKLAILLRVAS